MREAGMGTEKGEEGNIRSNPTAPPCGFEPVSRHLHSEQHDNPEPANHIHGSNECALTPTARTRQPHPPILLHYLPVCCRLPPQSGAAVLPPRLH